LLAGGSVIMVVAVATTLVFATHGSATVRWFATLHPLGGLVEAQRTGETAFGAAHDGEVLHGGDAVRTGVDGRTDVRYFDGSLTRLSPRTRLTLTELASRGPSKTIRLHQSIGRVLYRIARFTGSSSRAEVTTPVAVLTVRGTVLVVVVEPDGTTTVTVIEGIVDVRSRGKVVRLTAGRSGSFPPPPAPTSVRVFRAFSPAGSLRPGLRATSRVRGSCFSGSSAVRRSDAFRCTTAASRLFDPCFLDPADPDTLACVIDVFTGDLALLTLDRPLPRNPGGAPPGDPSVEPWAIEVASGARCGLVTGATAAIDGLRANYECSDGSWLWGLPDRSEQPWSILSSAAISPFPAREDLVPVPLRLAIT